MMRAKNSIATPDPSGDIQRSRLDQADAPILALGRELEENRAAVEAESERADALQEANPDDAETRAAAWAMRDAYRPLIDRFHAILNELRDRPASTLAGMAVKADAILCWLSPGGTEVPEDHEDGRVAWSLAQDVRRMAGVLTRLGGNPDAELIATCAKASDLERQVFFSGIWRDVEVDDPRLIEQRPLLERAVVLRATTLPGLRAKAAILALWDSDLLAPLDVEEEYWNTRMFRSLFCDLLQAPGVDPASGLALQQRLRAGPSDVGEGAV